MIKLAYIKSYEYIQEALQKHINQGEKIESLQEEVKNLKKSEALHIYYKNELNTLLNYVKKESTDYNISLNMVRTISYATMGNYKRVWLDYTPKDKNKIYGILQNNLAAGILIPKNGRSLALLNGEERCSYSVYIGKNEAPGIVNGSGEEKDSLVVDFIPSWIKIKEGDRVVTNGLDGIFFKGIPVGVVKSVIDKESYQKAIVKPYADTLHPEYFWVIE